MDNKMVEREHMRKAEVGFLNEHVLDPRKRKIVYLTDGLGDMGRGAQNVCWLGLSCG